MSNTDKNEWILLDTNLTTRLAILPAAQSHLYYEINEPGSGELKIPLDTISAGLITSGMFCECYYRGSSRGGFFVDNIKEQQTDGSEYEGRWLSVSGRGPLALLADAMVWDDGSGATTREFTDKTKGYILKTLIDEAQTRGSLANLSYDFSSTDDSASTAWTDNENYKLPVGTSLLDVARQFAKTGGFDFEINLVGGEFVLSAYIAGLGTDKSSTVFLRTGINCEEVSSDERGDQINNVMRVKYKGGFVTVTDPTSISTRRRREKLLSLEQAQTVSSATTYAAAKLAQVKDPKNGISVRVYDGMKPNIFLDYIMGDYIKLDILGIEYRYRVLGIQADFDGVDFSDIVLELNTILYDNDLEMNNDLDWLLNQWTTANDAGLIETSYWLGLGLGVGVNGTSIRSMAQLTTLLYLVGEHVPLGQQYPGSAIFDISTGKYSALSGVDPYPPFAEATAISNARFGGQFWMGADEEPAHCGLYYLDNSNVWQEHSVAYKFLGNGQTNQILHDTSYDGNAIYVAFQGVDKVLKPVTFDPPTGGTTIDIYKYVARWDGSDWTSLGGIGEADGDITGCRALCVFGGLLYGGFEADTIYGGVSPLTDQGLQSYSGGSWTPSGLPGLTGKNVQALKVAGSDLVIAADDTIFTWNGSATDCTLIGTLTGSTDSEAYCIETNLTDIYIGGNFVSVDGLVCNYIAKYSGGAWSSLAGGVDGVVYTMLYYNEDLYVGGDFPNAGTVLADSFAVYYTNFEHMLDGLQNSSNGFNMGAAIHAAPASSITDNDEVPFWEDVSTALRKITWANIKSTMKTYLDSIYVNITGDTMTGQLLVQPSNIGDGAIYGETHGDAFTADFEQYTDTDNVTSPLLYLYRSSTGSGNMTDAVILGESQDSGAGVISGDWINFSHEADPRFVVAMNGSVTTYGGMVVNENGSTDYDLRAETDTESNMLLVDSSEDKMYLGGSTDGLEISKGGKLKAIGTATWFDDVRVEPTVRGTGTKIPAYTNYLAGGSASGLYFYLFDNAIVALEKEVNFKLQLPHGKLLGSAIHIHVHWVPTSTGNAGDKVRWGLEYTKANPNGTFGAVGAYIYATDPISPPSTTPTIHTHYITEFADIDMTGDALSTILLCRLFRNSSDAADTFAGDVGLLYIDAHIEFSQLGSNDEYAQ